MKKSFKWTVEFEVDEMWIADGFDLTESRALNMLANDLKHAYVGTELKAIIINKPNEKLIRKAQGYRPSDENR